MTLKSRTKQKVYEEKGDKERRSEWEERRKKESRWRVKCLTTTRAIDAFIGEEEPTGKKEEQKKYGTGLQPSCQSSPTHMDQTVRLIYVNEDLKK